MNVFVIVEKWLHLIEWICRVDRVCAIRCGKLQLSSWKALFLYDDLNNTSSITASAIFWNSGLVGSRYVLQVYSSLNVNQHPAFVNVTFGYALDFLTINLEKNIHFHRIGNMTSKCWNGRDHSQRCHAIDNFDAERFLTSACVENVRISNLLLQPVRRQWAGKFLQI